MIEQPDTTGATSPLPPAADGSVLRVSGQQAVAETLASISAQSLRFFHGVGWHFWDSTRWSYDTSGVSRRALHSALAVLRRHGAGNKGIEDDIKACMSNPGQRGALEISSYLSAFAYTVEQMDADAYLLNCANGTLDLSTFQLHPHSQSDNITKVTRAAFDPAADQTEWLQFLDRVLPDPEVRQYIQRYIGLSLLGNVLEHILGIIIGTGANGKTTFYEVVSHALGDYAHTAESDLFMKAKVGPNSASPAIMALMGKRFVVASETEEGAPLAVALMKNLTGGDEITTRGLFKDPVTFRPSHTALMVTNHLPKVKGDDDALWRRISVIDFSVVIPREEQNPHLTDQLKLRSEAVLAWAVAGLQDYNAQGLNPPPAVLRSTAAYRTASDDMGRFVTTQIDTDPNGFVTRKALWTAWSDWANASGVALGKAEDFYTQLERRSFGPTTRAGVRGFKGLSLAKDDTTVDDDVFVDPEPEATA